MSSELSETRSEPLEARHRSSIKQQLSTLIHIANRAESGTVKTHHPVGRPETKPGDAPAELIASQLQVLELIASACEAGISLHEIQIDLVGPVIEEGVVGDLAWMAIRQVMAAATAKLKRDTRGFATETGRS